jgi:uncharacterized protein YceK
MMDALLHLGRGLSGCGCILEQDKTGKGNVTVQEPEHYTACNAVKLNFFNQIVILQK